MPASAPTGRGWSALRAALATEQRALDAASVARSLGCERTALAFEADARAAVAPYRPYVVSTFDGAQPTHIAGQERLF